MSKAVFIGLFFLIVGLVTMASGCTAPTGNVSGYKLKAVDVVGESSMKTLKIDSTSFKVQSEHDVRFTLKFKFDMKALSLMNDVVPNVKVTLETINPDFSITDVNTVNAEVVSKQPGETGYTKVVIEPKAGDEFSVSFTLHSKSVISYNPNRGTIYAVKVIMTTPMESANYVLTLDYY